MSFKTWYRPRGLCTIYCTGYCYGVVSYKATHALRPFSNLLFVRIWVLIVPNSSTRESPLANTSRHLIAKQGEAWRKICVNFAGEVSLSHSARICNMP
jgi:hypothetical protein